MNNIFKLLGVFLIMITVYMQPANADAQSMNPDTLLEIDPNIPQQESQPEPDVPPEWRMLNRLLACNTMEHVKGVLLQRGQVLWAGGGKQRGYMPNDPFDSFIITRNPITKEFTVVLIKPEINLACIIAGGEKLETVENLDLNINL